MAQIEILYFAGCPAYRRARTRVLGVLRSLGRNEAPKMVLVRHMRDAQDLDFHGSPTVRIDGKDLDPEGLALNPNVGLFSRTFVWKRKKYDAPPEEMILQAVRALPPTP